IAVPIRSTETGDFIAALVLGFKPVEVTSQRADTGMKSGILVDGELRLAALDKAAQSELAREVAQTIRKPDGAARSFRVTINGTPHLLLSTRLNLHSNYPPAY